MGVRSLQNFRTTSKYIFAMLLYFNKLATNKDSENSENAIMDKNLLTQFKYLREKNIQFIAVSNNEWYSLFRDEIRNSIAIEGIFSNRNDLLDVLEKNKKTTDQKTAAILGYFEAASTLYEYANILFKEDEFSIRLSDIRQVHTLLMRYEKQVGSFKGQLGIFRNENVIVNESRFTPLDYTFINETMEVFIKWLNKKISSNDFDKIKLAALSHLIFETIHPFRDGNGRSGRILLSFVLIGCGFINIAIKGTQKSDREKYYQAMEQGDEHFELMLREIEKGQKLTTKILDEYAKQSNSYLLEQIIINRLKDGLKRLSKTEMININEDALIPLRDVSKFYNYSQDYIRNLINKGKIKAQKRGKLWYVRIREIEKYLKEL